MSPRPRSERIALALSGGVALGAYEAGAYAALHAHAQLRPGWVLGSSVGAINSALIAGADPETRVDTLREFWNLPDSRVCSEISPDVSADAPGGGASGRASGGASWPDSWLTSARHYQHWANALEARLFGVEGQFRPKWMTFARTSGPSLYDLGPLRDQLRRLVDFGRLNGGETRVTIGLTDVETGEMVVIDTHKGERIELEHLLASCGNLPEFAPLDINGRLLGDGGLSANAPVYPTLLDFSEDEDLVCFVVDLYSRAGGRPDSLEGALARRQDLVFANQTWLQVEALRREHELRRTIARLAQRLPEKARADPEIAAMISAGRRRSLQLVCLNYRAFPEEAGSEKAFDYAPATVAKRWKAGEIAMNKAIRTLSGRRSGAERRGGAVALQHAGR